MDIKNSNSNDIISSNNDVVIAIFEVVLEKTMGQIAEDVDKGKYVYIEKDTVIGNDVDKEHNVKKGSDSDKAKDLGRDIEVEQNDKDEERHGNEQENPTPKGNTFYCRK